MPQGTILERLTRIEVLLDNHLKHRDYRSWILTLAVAIMAIGIAAK